jgi:hypothetical protein
MSGGPLRDLNCAARIHEFGDSRRTETVTTEIVGVSRLLMTYLIL